MSQVEHVSIKEKVKLVLDEVRMLVLGAQVVLGFQMSCFFQSGWPSITGTDKGVIYAGLFTILVALAVLLWPGAQHQIAEHGCQGRITHAFTTRTLEVAFLPLGATIALNLHVVGAKILSPTAGCVLAAGFGGIALTAWYGYEYWKRPGRAPVATDVGKTRLQDKVEQVLTEARVVLPGAQALLGFSLSAIFQQSFDSVKTSIRVALLVSICALCLMILLLMMPASYHRIVLAGECSEDFHRLAASAVLSAMGFLSVALGCDMFIATLRMGYGFAAALTAGSAVFLILLVAWFAVPLLCRSREAQG